MKAEIRNELPPFDRFALRVIKKKFRELAPNCDHGFIDKRGHPNCAYHPSAVGFCKFELCPKLKSKNLTGE